MVLLDVSFNDFLQKHDFDHFHLILFKRLSCEISFSDFVYLLLDCITKTENIFLEILWNFLRNIYKNLCGSKNIKWFFKICGKIKKIYE